MYRSEIEAKFTHEPHAYEKEAKYLMLRQLLELNKLIQIICSDSYVAGLKDSSVIKEHEVFIKKVNETGRLNGIVSSSNGSS